MLVAQAKYWMTTHLSVIFESKIRFGFCSLPLYHITTRSHNKITNNTSSNRMNLKLSRSFSSIDPNMLKAPITAPPDGLIFCSISARSVCLCGSEKREEMVGRAFRKHRGTDPSSNAIRLMTEKSCSVGRSLTVNNKRPKE